MPSPRLPQRVSLFLLMAGLAACNLDLRDAPLCSRPDADPTKICSEQPSIAPMRADAADGPPSPMSPPPAVGEPDANNDVALACQAGSHRCSDKCVDSASVEHCGASCSPCPMVLDGTAVCTSGACEGRCPDGKVFCKSQSACQAPTAPCGGGCPAGTHECSGSCVSNSDINSCGPTSCSACPTPANADASCDGRACAWSCRAGFQACGMACLALGIPCEGKCGAGETLCAGRCVANTQVPVENCGNGVDDDCDGAIDCADSNCGNGTACGQERICGSGQCIAECGNGPGQKCCEGAQTGCANNCGTMGTRTCRGGTFGACSAADTCCGDPACSNNCGEKGSRTCNGTTFGACPVPRRACCPGDTQTCSNTCGMTGSIACRGGAFNKADCTAKESACAGGEGQACRPGKSCDNGLFCCPDSGICGAEVNRCLRRRDTGGQCNYADGDGQCLPTHYCDGDHDACQPRVGRGATCFNSPGSPKCASGLSCNEVTSTCQ